MNDGATEKDFSILFKILDINKQTAVKIASESKMAQERYERFKHDITAFIKYYFPDYVTLEPAEWQKAIFRIFENPEWDIKRKRWIWKVTEEQRAELAKYHRKEFRELPKAIDLLRAIALIAPREQGKSTVFARLVIIWLIIFGYLKFGVLIRSSSDIADSFLADTMDEFISNPKIIQDFGNLKGTIWKEGTYTLKNGTAFVSVGRGASLRGLIHKSTRPDFIILDDITTDTDKNSPTTLNKTYDYITSAVMGLSKKAVILYLNTIFNEMDPMARIIERITDGDLPSWLGLRFSAEIDDNTALWPEYWPLEDLRATKRELGSITYNIEYMSLIAEEKGKILPPSIFKFRKECEIYLPDYDIRFGCDPNAEGNDDAAITVTGRNYATGHYLTLDAWEKDSASITELVDKLVEWNYKYHPTLIGFEEVAFQKVYMKLIQEILLPQKVELPIVGLSADGNKLQRATTTQPFIENGSWEFHEKLKGSIYMMKLNKFPARGLNDGPIDATYYSWKAHNREVGQPIGIPVKKRNNDLPNLIGRYKNAKIY